MLPRCLRLFNLFGLLLPRLYVLVFHSLPQLRTPVPLSSSSLYGVSMVSMDLHPCVYFLWGTFVFVPFFIYFR